jgi:hypothetical protein
MWVTSGGQRLFPTIVFFNLDFGELRSLKALLGHVKPISSTVISSQTNFRRRSSALD